MNRLGDVLFEMRWELLLWGPWAAASLVVMAWFAFGRDRDWDGTPRRESSVTWVVPLIGIGVMMFGGSAADQIIRRLPSPAGVSPLTMLGVAALIGQVLAMGSPALLFVLWACLVPPGSARSVGLLPRKPMREWLVGGLAFVLVTPAVMGVNTLMVLVGLLAGADRPDVGHDMLQQMRSAQTWLELAPLLLSAVVLAPLFEEAIFRGMIQTPMVQHPFLRQRRWLIIMLSAVLFTAVHSAVIWQVVPGLLLLGVTLAWLYERTGSLWPGVVVHLLFNLTNVLFALLLLDPA